MNPRDTNVKAAGNAVLRGHPLVALLALLFGWIGGRTLAWEPPALVESAQAIGPAAAGIASPAAIGPQSQPGAFPPQSDYNPYVYDYPSASPPGYAMATWPGYARAGRREARYVMMPGPSGRYPPPDPQPRSLPHLREDFDLVPPPPPFHAPGRPVGAPGSVAADVPVAAPPRPRRWSVDSWALLRRESHGALAAPGVLPATYGASQTGVALRYRIDPANRHRPTLYLRTTAAIGRVKENALAAGLSARPFAAIPIIAAIEARLTEQLRQRRFQPAVMAVTELAPFPLPAGLRGEVYAQGGYVGGRFATPFADGQIRADHALIDVGPVRARVGGGIWGGVQKGAGRLDAGPSASVAMPLGRGMHGRIAVDWRFRMAGDAVPESGPAVTLSAGF